jgi:ankyrin repeat protein
MLSDATRTWLQENHFDVNDLDKTATHDDTPIILASRRGEVQIVAELIEAGVNINHRNMDGTNALWSAVVANSETVADMLIAHGADIDNQNDNGATALMYASSNSKPEWVKYLLGKGANRTLKSLDDYTALDLANTIEILRLLRKAG